MRRGPSVVMRGSNPLTWTIQRLLAEWRFRRVSADERSFVAAVTGAPMARVNSIYDELDACVDPSNHTLTSSILAPAIADNKLVLYALVRILKPDRVVETDVSSGNSSTAILQALEDNGGGGELFSIDLPSNGHVLKDGGRYPTHPKLSGWVVPDHLRSRWHPTLGDAKVVLPD